MRISVVMATFNGEKYVLEQIESILRNTRPPDEIIIMDDRSTDGTVRMLERLIERSSGEKIRLYKNEKNLGATRNFIAGAERAIGDIIFFSDQDDVWRNDKIELMSRAFEKDPRTMLVFSDGRITDADLQPTGRTIFSTRRKPELSLGPARSTDDVARDPDIKGCTMAVSSSLYKQIVANRNPDPFDHWGHDHWLALFAFGLGKVKVLHELLLDHRLHSSNSSAGVKFDPFKPAHWRRWSRLARNQQEDHEVMKYQIAIEHADRSGAQFDPLLKRSLERMMEIAKRRQAVRTGGAFERFRLAYSLHREGIYRDHFNGVWSMIRDLVS